MVGRRFTGRGHYKRIVIIQDLKHGFKPNLHCCVHIVYFYLFSETNFLYFFPGFPDDFPRHRGHDRKERR